MKTNNLCAPEHSMNTNSNSPLLGRGWGRFFSLTELSRTSQPYDNTPSAEVQEHLHELVETVLDDIRAQYGRPIRVTSGYRSPRVNRAVGGSSTSAHVYGYAADIKPVDGDMAALQRVVLQWAATHTGFDQIILEYPKNGLATWIHIGVRNRKGAQRHQVLTRTKQGMLRFFSGSSISIPILFAIFAVI